MNPTRQLPLDLEPRPAHGREDFLVSPSNEAAYALIDGWPRWPEGGALLVGPPGAGKSHLATIFRQTAAARSITGAQIRQMPLPDLLAAKALAVEDLDAGIVDEQTLFHLLNMAREAGVPLLLTAGTAPAAWGISTPDLISRLRAMVVVAIGSPDEPLLRALLVKLFVDRQLVVDTSVVDYLMLHLDRSFGSMQDGCRRARCGGLGPRPADHSRHGERRRRRSRGSRHF